MDRPDVATLCLIAADACVSQVLGVGATAVLLADDVIGLAAVKRVIFEIRQYSQIPSARVTTRRRKSAAM